MPSTAEIKARVRTPFGITNTERAIDPYDDADEWDRLMVAALVEHRRNVRVHGGTSGLPRLIYADAGYDGVKAAWVTEVTA